MKKNKPRLVLLRIDDSDVTHLEVIPWYGPPGYTSDEAQGHAVPVPEDDQLMRDLDEFTNNVMLKTKDPYVFEMGERIRAAAGLDEE